MRQHTAGSRQNLRCRCPSTFDRYLSAHGPSGAARPFLGTWWREMSVEHTRICSGEPVTVRNIAVAGPGRKAASTIQVHTVVFALAWQ